ncbi:MAG: hypothetical protein HKN87_23050 [Saprospiraceae bacterium]|nr:hypothetical protein [Saprospiraceae bacterium]
MPLVGTSYLEQFLYDLMVELIEIMIFTLRSPTSLLIKYFFLIWTLLVGLVASGQPNCPALEAPIILNSPQVFGNGTPQSCTQIALQSALNTGGEILCNCGPDSLALMLTSPLLVTNTTILDGAGLVILDGNNTTRIIDKAQNIDFTIQRITLRNGKAPGPSGHFTNQCGGAILSRGGGVLKAIDCQFNSNTVTSTNGSDIAGGAVYVFGEQEGRFSNCTFEYNSASNGGAIGGLGSDIIIANCLFFRNAALGTSGGLRGHGGAINLDGVEIAAANKLFQVCGTEFIENHAETQGGASNTVFSDNVGAKLEIDQCYFEGNYLRSISTGSGGAIFHVVDDFASGYGELQFEVTRSTFHGNYCLRQGGGIWSLIVGQGIIENCTFYRDSTSSIDHGLGGGAIVSTVSDNLGHWLIRSNTFARNYAGLFGGGFFGSPVAPITWQNNILFDNKHSNGNPWVGLNVNRQMDNDLGGNIQWPQFRPNGTEDTKATATSQFLDAALVFPLAYRGGPTQTLGISAGSPAVNAGLGCPPTDQRLANRSGTCDLGSYEDSALSLPTSVHVGGQQYGHKYYIASQLITSDATLTGEADLTFDASESDLQSSFNVRPGSSLLLK